MSDNNMLEEEKMELLKQMLNRGSDKATVEDQGLKSQEFAFFF